MTVNNEALAIFEELALGFLGRPGVTRGKIFNNDGLKVGRKSFALVVRGQLLLKVPHETVTRLVDCGEGVAFEPMAGRTMREWVLTPLGSAPSERARWSGLMEEAYTFVAAIPEQPRPAKAAKPRQAAKAGK